jgi:glyoxylase-like metal-dependent hydrolase (beta-lactamase superfamily II)
VTDLLSPRYEVIAIRYATRLTSRRESFYRYGSAGQELDAPLRMDYYFWLLRNQTSSLLVDTGFHPEVGRRRGRTTLVEPLRALTLLGLRPADVSRIIVTHLHYDHIGNLAAFPQATLSVPRAELDFWTSSESAWTRLAVDIEAAEIDYVAGAWRQGRVQLVDGHEEIAPGVIGRVVGGHSPGQQITLINGERGAVVLASDALHFYEEMERDRPFEVFVDLLDLYRGYDTLRDLQQGGGEVVAGHDPAVMDRFSPLEGELNEFAVRVA